MKFILFISLLIPTTSLAQSHFCTPWVQKNNTSCIFLGPSADLRVRKCENPFGQFSQGAHCDREYFCHDENPHELTTSFTAWTEDRGRSCANHVTGGFEQKWERAAQKGLVTV
jgi:hypothetical protein